MAARMHTPDPFHSHQALVTQTFSSIHICYIALTNPRCMYMYVLLKFNNELCGVKSGL